jgi:hypothetical protein
MIFKLMTTFWHHGEVAGVLGRSERHSPCHVSASPAAPARLVADECVARPSW